MRARHSQSRFVERMRLALADATLLHVRMAFKTRGEGASVAASRLGASSSAPEWQRVRCWLIARCMPSRSLSATRGA